jgi:hypothetical protein
VPRRGPPSTWRLAKKADATLFAFDFIEISGFDMRKEPIETRKGEPAEPVPSPRGGLIRRHPCRPFGLSSDILRRAQFYNFWRHSLGHPFGLSGPPSRRNALDTSEAVQQALASRKVDKSHGEERKFLVFDRRAASKAPTASSLSN